MPPRFLVGARSSSHQTAVPGIRYKRSRLPWLFVYICTSWVMDTPNILKYVGAAMRHAQGRCSFRFRGSCTHIVRHNRIGGIPRFSGRIHVTYSGSSQSMHAYISVPNPRDMGFRYVQDWSAQALCRTCVINFQPCTLAQTNPTPGLILTLTPTLRGARGRQGQLRVSAACLGGDFQKKMCAAERPA